MLTEYGCNSITATRTYKYVYLYLNKMFSSENQYQLKIIIKMK
jgi:hypothetical protein